MGNIFLKTLRDKRFFILGWSLGVALLGFAMTTFYPSFNGGQIDSLLSSLPPALEGLVGNLQDWRELPGYLGSQIFDIRLPIFISILSILLTVSLTVGEEEKGQLKTLVALPVSRRSIVMGKWLAIALICLVASLATIVGIELGLLAIGETVDQLVLLRLGLFTWLLVTSLATIISAVGLVTGRRAVTTGIAIVIAVGSFLVSTFAQAVDWLKDWEWLSFFHYFPAVDIAKGVVGSGDVIFYVVGLILALLAALIFFPRRDLR